jgi:endoglucanase
MDLDRDKAIDLLRAFTAAHGAPGGEKPVRSVFERELRGCGEFVVDRTGGIGCTIAGADTPKVLVAGHMDEVGFMVQNITPEGYLQFLPLGGWWAHTVLAQRVRILTRSGAEVIGVTTSVPPHFLGPDAKNAVVPIERMFIDIGASSAEEVTHGFGVGLGDTIVPDSPLTPLANPDRLVAKAFDNRVGMAIATLVGKWFGSSPPGGGLPNTLVVAGTAQEEVGTRGAQTFAEAVRPDVALILEGPPADDTPGMNPAEAQGVLGGGCQVRLYDPSAIMNRDFAEFVIATAEARGIPYQVAVRRSGGTDARAIHLSGVGVPCVVIGVPARYIHSHNAVIDIHDFLAATALTSAVVERLDEETVAGF